MGRHRKKVQVDLEQAKRLYWGDKLSLTDTSRRMGCSPEILRIRMIEKGIPLRTRLEGFHLRYKKDKDEAMAHAEC